MTFLSEDIAGWDNVCRAWNWRNPMPPKVARAAPAKQKKFATEEYVRIVPLHHPKPAYSIDELSRLRRERQPQDLFGSTGSSLTSSSARSSISWASTPSPGRP